MATFLAYRSLGFDATKTLRLMHRDREQLDFWHDNYPEFCEFEYKYLPKLQRVLSKNIIRLSMMQNMMLCLTQDNLVLTKMHEDGLEKLSNREWQYIQMIRPRYTSSDLLAVERIVSPEDYRGGDAVINLTWDTREQKIEIHNSGPELLDASDD